MLFQHRDGELHVYEHGNSGSTYYLEILFTNASLSGPLARPRTEEILYTDRGNLDTNAGYREGTQAATMEPMPLTFTCRLANTAHTDVMRDWFSGATTVRSKRIYSRSGIGIAIPQMGTTGALPAFKDSGKMVFLVESLWSGSGVSNLGIRWDEVYFPPNEQTITEGEDAITLNLNGQIYGGVTTLIAFRSHFKSSSSVSAINGQ